MKASSEIRRSFLEFFRTRGHEPIASGPLVPANDPTLMFANAGMVQFKDVFTGKEQRAYRRACTSQKCIRISGKHNDLENVGVTARHHTFFEMLGNFSFGDYFKEDAIAYAWEFFTNVLGLSRDRLIVTVFGGEEGLPADEDAEGLWRRISGLPSDRIVRCGAADNFWQMGDTGPCGPCSEIHYFMGSGAPDVTLFGKEPGPDGRGWVELWNLVFMQFDKQVSGELKPLPAPSIDTGAGLERLCAVVQGVVSNYDTDLLRPVVDLASEISKRAYKGTLEPHDVSMRVIADHARAAAFLISEGIFPDRDGRAYVLRRIMRRAIRHGHRLGIERLFFHECALKVVDIMGDAYPELVFRRALVEEVSQQEEERFRKTLKRGLELVETNDEWQTTASGQKSLPGSVAFLLYDTYGFPLDLQDVIGQEQGFAVDHDGFDRAMADARERSAGSKIGDRAVQDIYHQLAQKLGPTTFVGYDCEHKESSVVALLEQGQSVERLASGGASELIAKETPFYAESGGQVGDQGAIVTGKARFLVEDTHRPVEGLVVHRGRVVEGEFRVGETVALEVDHARRSATRRNHSATHLLHYALRRVVGAQATQKGSLVGPDRLRFDYSSGKPLERSQIEQIEDLVNAKILLNAPIETEVLGYDEAKAKGAIGIFEEKYGAVVRMLRMTDDSVELCGGTHASRTGDLGCFKIVSDTGLAAGVRRIEAATGENALRYVRSLETELGQSAALLKSNPLQVHERVERVLTEYKQLQKEIERLKRQLVSGQSNDVTSDGRRIGEVYVLGAAIELGDAGALRELAEQLRDKHAPAVVLLGTKTPDGKAALVCAVSKELTKRYSAGTLVKAAAQVVGGGGGGRPDFAQAGGSNPAKLDEAVQSVYSAVSG